MKNQNLECCPRFDPAKWDNKTLNWNNKPFIKATLPTFFHIPLPFVINSKMKRLFELAEKAQANLSDLKEALVLFRDPTPFKSEIYYAVTQPVKGAINVSLSGTYRAGVFEGPYNSVPKHIKVMEEQLSKEKLEAKDYLIHYAYCPKCAKKYGKNYMILFALL